MARIVAGAADTETMRAGAVRMRWRTTDTTKEQAKIARELSVER
jgi:hypothetical protein